MKQKQLIHNDIEMHDTDEKDTETKKKIVNPFKKSNNNKTNYDNIPEPEEDDTSVNSFKSIQNKVKKYYRPLIKEFIKKNKYKQYKVQKYTEDFEKYPHIYDNTYCEDNGNSTMRYVIPSLNKIIEDYKFMNNSKIPLTFYCNPLNMPSNNEKEIPVVDKFNWDIFRCERCKAFINPNFEFQNNYNSYSCNICDNKGKINPKYEIDDNSPEINNGSYEFFVDNSKFQINKNGVTADSICIIIQSTNEMISTGAFESIINNWDYLVSNDSIPSNFNLSFITLDDSIQFYKYINENNIEVWNTLDIASSPYSVRDLSLNIKDDKDKINELLNFIKDHKFSNYNNNYEENNKISIDYINSFKSIKDLFNEEGGRAIFFIDNTTNIFPKDQFKNLGEDKKKFVFNSQFNSNNPILRNYVELGNSMQNSNIVCELFYFSFKNNYNLIPLTQVFKKTSGQVNIYETNNDIINYDRFYYDIYNCLNKNMGFDIAFRVRFDPCLNIVNYYTPIGVKNDLDFCMSGLNSNQSIVCNFSQASAPKKEYVCLQFVTLYTNIQNQRLIRIHNIKLPTEKNKLSIYKILNSEIITYSLLKEYLYQFDKLSIYENEKNLFKRLNNIMGHYRYDCGNNYDPKEFAMPNTLKYLPLYVYNLLSKPMFCSVLNLSYNSIFQNLVELENMDLYFLIFNLNPKIFKINLNILNKDYGLKNEDLNLVIFPPSIPCLKNIIKDDNIYIMDNGKNILVYIKDKCSEELLYQAFGINNFEEVKDMTEIPVLDSDLNIRINNIIEGINDKRINYIQDVIIIPDHSNNDKYIAKIYTEAFISKKGNSYWAFLNRLHKKIKESY